MIVYDYKECLVEKRELVILGAGPAGLTAAIYGKRAGLDTLLIERGLPGGQIATTADVENWPGITKISGMDLAQSLYDHAAHFEAELRATELLGLDVDGDTKIIRTEKGDIEAKAVIIAVGARHKPLGCPGEAEFSGKGVSYCAVCDAAFYRNEEVAVIGGGNTAVEEAEYLTRFASKVYLVHRREELRADRMVADRVLANPKIVPVWNSVVERIEGGAGVDKVVIKNTKTNAVSELAVTGVFIFVGTLPNTSFLGSVVHMTPDGWITTKDENMQTSVPGIFAAGDVRDTELRQMVTAAADGARAAMAAYRYIVSH